MFDILIASSQFSSIPYAFAARTAENGVPSGTIIAFAGNNVPNGWLLCDGTSYGSAQYPALYNAIGANWGGNANIFYVPDLRGRFLRGVSGASGNDPDAGTRTASNTGGQTGNAVGSLQDDAFESHNHLMPAAISTDVGTGNQGNRWTQVGDRTPQFGFINNFATLDTGGSETRPKNANVRYIIKY